MVSTCNLNVFLLTEVCMCECSLTWINVCDWVMESDIYPNFVFYEGKFVSIFQVLLTVMDERISTHAVVVWYGRYAIFRWGLFTKRSAFCWKNINEVMIWYVPLLRMLCSPRCVFVGGKVYLKGSKLFLKEYEV